MKQTLLLYTGIESLKLDSFYSNGVECVQIAQRKIHGNTFQPPINPTIESTTPTTSMPLRPINPHAQVLSAKSFNCP